MALTIQNVVDDVSRLTHLDLDGEAGSGADYTLLVRWIDQVHKDLLHTGPFQHALRRTTTITSVAGTYSYAITPADIRRIDAVFDRASSAFLSPLEDLFSPANTADLPDLRKTAPRPPKEAASFRVTTAYPQYYRFSTTVTAGTNAHTLYLFPTSAAVENAGVVDIFYTRQVANITGATTALEVGEDGRDAMMAGVAAIAFSYMGMEPRAAAWRAVYERAKMGERV